MKYVRISRIYEFPDDYDDEQCKSTALDYFEEEKDDFIVSGSSPDGQNFVSAEIIGQTPNNRSDNNESPYGRED